MEKVGLNFTFSLTTNEIDFDEISWYPTRPTCCYNYGRNRRVQPVHVERATTEQSRVSLTTSDISRIQRARILRLLRKRASFREIFFADPRKKKRAGEIGWIYIKLERRNFRNDRNRHVTISKLLRSKL